MSKSRKPKKKWELVTEYDQPVYACGLRAGDRVRLEQEIVVRDWKDRPTGVVHRAGEIWVVLHGASQSPGVVWLRQPDGERHTWDDNEEIFEWFEVVEANEPPR